MFPGPVGRRRRWRSAPRCRLIGRKNRWRISRIVTLPDYQGIGIGMARGRGGGRAAPRRGPPRERHGQPPGPDRPLPPLAAMAGGGREEDRVGAEPSGSSAATAARAAGPWCRSSTSGAAESRARIACRIRHGVANRERSDDMAKRGRRPVWTRSRRREILAILAVGAVGGRRPHTWAARRRPSGTRPSATRTSPKSFATPSSKRRSAT